MAGCAQPAAGPDLFDRGELERDIAAPPPEDIYEDHGPYDPPGVPWIHGQVFGSDGKPLPRAEVWLEAVNLRDQVHNLDAYLESRGEWLVRTDGGGRFRFLLNESVYHLMVEAPGHRPMRVIEVAALVDAEPHEIRLQARGQPHIVAHRGASFYAPENTLASLWKARWLGADTVEVDVRLTRDGQLVAFHDPELDRTTNGTGKLRDHDLASLRGLDAGSWFHPSFQDERILTLEEFLLAAEEAGVHLMIDVKSPPDLRAATWTRTLAVIRDADATSRVTFAAFREEAVHRCAQEPGLDCMWLRQDPSEYLDLVAAAEHLGATSIGVQSTLVDEALMADARQVGIRVLAWTLNDPADWRPLLALGIDALATDYPGYLVDDLNGVDIGFV